MLPNFIIAGNARCGTTSLYYYLSQHPEADIPRKETFYFAREFYKNIPNDGPPGYRDKSRIIYSEKEYDDFYKRCTRKAIGEVSTCFGYLHKSSVSLIKKKLGDVKIIFLLRNPVERAFSGYKHFVWLTYETLSFEDAIEKENERMKLNWDFMWHYVQLGFYAKQVKEFQNNFSNVKIILSEDFEQKTNSVMKEIFRFIGVDENFKCDTSFRYNFSDENKSTFKNILSENPVSEKIIKPFIKKMMPEKERMEWKHRLREPLPEKMKMNPETRQKLIGIYKSDILELEKMLERDLNHWLR